MAKGAQTRSAQVQSAYQVLPVVGPSAGVDLRTSPTLLPPEKARTLVNWSLSEPGTLLVRSGYVAFSSQWSTSRIQGASRIYLNTSIPAAASTRFTLAAVDGGVYEITDAGALVSTTPSLSGLSTGPVQFLSDRDLVAVFDNSTSPWKSTNGSSWTRLGIASGTNAVLSSLSTGGLSSGEYSIGYTYKDRDLAHESNGQVTGSTITISASSGAIKAVIPNSTDAQVDAIVVYAQKISAGETVRRKVSSQAQSTAATSTVVITSTNWTTADEEPTDHNTPTTLAFGAVWKNRWWARSATVTNRIHFTQLFQPQSWPSDYYVDIPFEKGDAIRAMIPLGNTLFIFGTTRVYQINGETSLDFVVLPSLAAQDGALGFNAVATLENGVVHAGPNGIYIFDGATDNLLSHAIEPAWRDYISNATPGDLTQTSLVYHQQQKELRCAVSRRYPSAARGEWVLDLNRTRLNSDPSWTATDRDIVGYCLWNGPEDQAGNQQILLSWPSTGAQLFREAIGTTANSSNMVASYEGPGLSLGMHRARWVDLRIEYEPHGGTVGIEPTIDGVSMGSQNVTIGTGLALYSTAVYNTAVYAGSGRRQAYQVLPLRAEGRSFVLALTYTGQEAFRVFSYHPGLVPERQSRSFSE